jgi:metal-responsive CopG/Arc/MetJ family transcriptional regulator
MNMSRIERIGVSLEKELLAAFDGLIARQGYPSRSEAPRTTGSGPHFMLS